MTLINKQFIERLINIYCYSNKRSYSLFQMLKDDYLGIDIIDSWKWIADYIPKEKITVLLGSVKGGKVIEVSNGTVFCELYDKLPFIEFYLSNSNFDYLIGFNHSQCLITMGKACDWLEKDHRYMQRYN